MSVTDIVNYKKGVESRRNILHSAKKKLYEHGYKKTTIDAIAKDAQVPASLVAYYFKKDELLTAVHEDYVQSILDAITEQVGSQLDNNLQKHLLLTQIHNMGIYSDEKNLNVFQYMVNHGITSQKVQRIVDSYLLKLIDDFELNLSEDEFERMIVAQYGANRELIRVYLKEYDPLPAKRLLYFAATIALRLAQLNHQVINANIEKTDELLEKMDISGIRFLV